MKHSYRNLSGALRRILLFTCLLLSPVLQASDTPAEERRLLVLLDEFLAGASINDAAMHDRFWAPELIYTSSSGARYGKAEIMQTMPASDDRETDEAPADTSAAAPPMPRYWAEDQQVMVMGDTAVVAFRLMAEIPGESGAVPAQLQFFNTGTFRLRDGQWQAVAWQATKIPEDTAD